MSVVHILPIKGSKESELSFKQFRNMTKAPFVIYADFESILVPENNQVKFTNYTQKHKVCAAAAILCSTIPEKDNLMTIHCGPNALSEFLDKLIV